MKRRHQWLFGTGLVLLAGLAITGCGGGDTSTDAATPPTTQPAAAHTVTEHEAAVQATSDPRIARADGSPTSMSGLDTVACLATAAQTGGSYSFLEIRIPAGSGPPPHQHDTGDEFFYVVSGSLAIGIGDLQADVGPGDYFHVPRATTHTIRATADTLLVAGYAPGGAEGPLFCDAAT